MTARLANRALNRLEVQERRIDLSSTPLQMNVELTGVCNINPPCVFCSGKNVGYNYRPLDATYLDAYSGYLERCEYINEDSFGEPLSHPELLAVAQRFIRNGQGFSLVTNGLLLSGEKAEALTELGPGLGLHVSFNAATAKTFYRLTGEDFDVLFDNVRNFVALYRRRHDGAAPDLTITFIVMRVNRHEVPDFLRMAATLGVTALLAPLHERPSRPLGKFGYDFVYEREMLSCDELQAAGEEAQRLADSLGLRVLLQWDTAFDSAIRKFAEPGVDIPCVIPWRYLHLQQHSRKVYACPYHKRPIGDTAEQSLEEIWNGDTALELRRSLAGGRIPRFCWNNSASCPLIYEAKRQGFPDDPLTGDITIGVNDYCHLGEGWHAVEEVPERVRWTSGRAAFRIAVADHTTLCVRCQSFKPDIETDPARGSIEIGGRTEAIRLSRAGWHEVRVPIPGATERPSAADPGLLAAAILVENTWVPADILESSVCEPVIGIPKLVAGSYDTRELGIVVQRIWVE